MGDFAYIFGTTTCSIASGTQVNINTSLTNQNYSFTNTHAISGVGGSVTYSGSLGPVNSCNGLHFSLFQPGTLVAHNSATGTPWGSGQQLISNGARYDGIAYQSSNDFCSVFLVDILFWYQAPGTSGSCCDYPYPGDPYLLETNVSTSTVANHNVSFGDTNTW